MSWNFGDILDGIGDVLPPDAPALIHGDDRLSWSELTARSNDLARALVARGARPDDKVAFYMRNRVEYLVALVACFKARLVHVNVNYRYTPDEVWYIFDNSDAQTVVYASEFRDAVTQVRDRLPKVKTWVEVSEGGGTAPFAEPFHALADNGDGSALQLERSGQDLLFIYTGGTTGMPKGVMWPHHDLREVTLSSARKLGPVPETLEALREHTRKIGPGGRALIAPPLMHGTGLLTAIGTHLAGGSLVTLAGETFDPVEMLDAIERHKP